MSLIVGLANLFYGLFTGIFDKFSVSDLGNLFHSSFIWINSELMIIFGNYRGVSDYASLNGHVVNSWDFLIVLSLALAVIFAVVMVVGIFKLILRLFKW